MKYQLPKGNGLRALAHLPVILVQPYHEVPNPFKYDDSYPVLEPPPIESFHRSRCIGIIEYIINRVFEEAPFPAFGIRCSQFYHLYTRTAKERDAVIQRHSELVREELSK